MKKHLVISVFIATLLTACGNSDKNAATKPQKDTAGDNVNYAENIVNDKCLVCHVAYKKPGTHLKKLHAPPLNGIVYHLEKKFTDTATGYFDTDMAVEFISDYVLNPDTAKSLCDKSKIKYYGIMPSLKGSVTKDELEDIAYFIIDSFATKR